MYNLTAQGLESLLMWNYIPHQALSLLDAIVTEENYITVMTEGVELCRVIFSVKTRIVDVNEFVGK